MFKFHKLLPFRTKLVNLEMASLGVSVFHPANQRMLACCFYSVLASESCKLGDSALNSHGFRG